MSDELPWEISGYRRHAFSPRDVPGLGLWLRADLGVTMDPTTNAVSAWADQSGNARHAAQSTSARQPIWGQSVTANGRPAITFDGAATADDRLLVNPTITPAVIYAVAKCASPAGHVATVLSGPGPPPRGYQGRVIYWQTVTGSASWKTTGFNEGTTRYTNGVLTDGVAADLGFEALYEAVDTTPDLQPPNPSICIGNDQQTDGRTWEGWIAEVMIYTSAVSASNRTKIVNYVNSLYMLAAV